MNKKINPSTIAPPYKNIFSHAIESSGDVRQLWLSGQLGTKLDGSIDPDIEGQSEHVMRNMKEVLAASGMTFADVVKINAYFLDVADIPKFAAIRSRYLEGAQPAMTSVVVSALAAPQWLIEVDAIAVKQNG